MGMRVRGIQDQGSVLIIGWISGFNAQGLSMLSIISVVGHRSVSSEPHPMCPDRACISPRISFIAAITHSFS